MKLEENSCCVYRDPGRLQHFKRLKTLHLIRILHVFMNIIDQGSLLAICGNRGGSGGKRIFDTTKNGTD